MPLSSAVTAASHLALIFAVVLLLLEVVGLLRHPEALLRVKLGSSTRTGLYAVGAAVVVERAWYVAARTTAHRGTDLWEFHPIPEILSGLVAASVLLAWSLLVTEALGGWRRARGTVMRHVAFLVVLWVVVAATMRGLA